jgi:protein associated with RNAse G/E
MHVNSLIVQINSSKKGITCNEQMNQIITSVVDHLSHYTHNNKHKYHHNKIELNNSNFPTGTFLIRHSQHET